MDCVSQVQTQPGRVPRQPQIAEPTNIKATRISTVSITLSLRETNSAERDQSKVAGVRFK